MIEMNEEKNIFHNRDHVRFVIISVLPEPLKSDMAAINQDFYDRTGSKTALLYPPHITMRTGAVVPVAEVDKYISGFKSTVETFRENYDENKTLKISDPDWIDYSENGINKHLILYFVERTPWIINLNKTLLQYKDHIKSNKTDFHPHISLAYDDLDDADFEKLKDHINQNSQMFRKNISFTLPDISLYYQDDDGYWKEYYTVKL